MQFREKLAVYSENHMKRLTLLRGHMAALLVKVGGKWMVRLSCFSLTDVPFSAVCVQLPLIFTVYLLYACNFR
jgi:hypothetical protein